MKVNLVPMNKSNVRKTYDWIQNTELRRLFLMRGEITLYGHMKYFEGVLSDKIQVWYAIYLDDTHVGNCGVKLTNPDTKECTLWIYIGDTNVWGNGVGTIATKNLIDNAFHVLGMNRIVIHVAGFNIRALKMYRTLGFVEVPCELGEEWKDRGCEIVTMCLVGKR